MLCLFARGGFASPSEARFRWQVLSRPSRAPTAWVAESKDASIVGTYCGTPLPLRVCGRDALGVHGSHAMTDPRFRRQGILTALAGAAQAAWAAAGYRLQIGVPWGTWGSRRRALGWVTVADLVWMRRWLRPERALARRLRLPAFAQHVRVWDRLLSDPPADSGVRVRVLTTAEPVLDDLWAKTARTWDHAVIRDTAWLDWRYFQVPGQPYRVLLAERAGEPLGYLALKIGPSQTWIADLVATQPADTALIRTALAASRELGAERVDALVALGSPAQRALAAARFVGKQGGDFAVVPLDPDLAVDEVTRAERWLVAGGDFDVV
jgi:GNAT superfamily N-acetyltransferase